MELHHELQPRQVDHYRTKAKKLLRAVRDGDAGAVERAQRAIDDRVRARFVLADALYVVAVEHGHRSWPAFKHDVESQVGATVRSVGRISTASSDAYAAWADRLLADAQRREPVAIERLRARVPRLRDRPAATIAQEATVADARICLASEYGFRTWAELAESADRAHDTHYSGLSAELPWKRAEAAIQAGDAETLRRLLDKHPGLESEDPGLTLLGAAAQPEAGSVPHAVVDVLIEAGSELDVPLNLAACFNKADVVGWLLDAGADASATPIWGITPLQSATYHGSREAVDVLVARTGRLPDAFYIAAAADDIERMAAWFRPDGRLLPTAMRDRPNLSDVGWPPQPPPSDDPADVLAEALSLAAQLGRTRARSALLNRGADPARAPLYGITALHFAASMARRDTIACSSGGVRRSMPAIACMTERRSTGRCITPLPTRRRFDSLAVRASLSGILPSVKYEIIAAAYRDLEQATGRRALVERLASLLAQTPTDVLPTVCYLCQGQIAPEFAGVDLGLAEKLAVRAVATATGATAEQVSERVRETGDLGEAAEQLLAGSAAGRPGTLIVGEVVDTLHAIASSEGQGSQGRKLDLLAGLLAQATPLEARYLLRLVTGNLRLGIGTPSLLDALAQVYADGKAARPVLERAYNICCDLGLVASTVATGGLAAVEELQVRPGNPVRVMLAQRLSEADEILAKLGGECAAEYKYDGVRVQAHRTADGEIELFTRRLERISTQFPDVVDLLKSGLGPQEAILEGEVVAFDPAAGELRPFQEVMFRRRKHGIAEAVRDVPVGLFCFDLLYADGEDLTRLPYPQRRARLSDAITPAAQLRLTTAVPVATAPALDAAFEQAVADGCEGLLCKSVGSTAIYQAGARGWLWIKLKRDYRTELSDTVDLVVVGAFSGRGRRRGVYGAVLLAAYDPDADVFRTVGKCGTGFSDVELAALPERLAPLVRTERPAGVDARTPADVWFEPAVVLEVLSAELTLSPNHTAGWGQLKENTGLAMRFPRFTGRWRDDKGAQDATTTQELVDLYRTARRAPATT